jgi:putative flippase GtrA
MRAPSLAHQISRFAVIGAISTAAYLGLYVALRGSLGAFGANALALAVTAIANTAANRRLTFGVSKREGMLRHQVQGLGVFGLALAVTSGALAALHAVQPSPSRWVEISALLAANAAATALRFVLLRHWVFRATAPPETGTSSQDSHSKRTEWLQCPQRR